MAGLWSALGLGGAPRASASGQEVDPDELRELIHSATQPKVDSVVVKSDARPVSSKARAMAGVTDVEQHAPAVQQQHAQQQQQQHHLAAAARQAAEPPSTSGAHPHWVLTSVYGVTNLSSGEDGSRLATALLLGPAALGDITRCTPPCPCRHPPR